MKVVIVEGLDGVGKTFQIHKVIDHLYEKYNLKSFTGSPLDLSPEIKSLVYSDYPPFVRYYLLLDAARQLLRNLKRDYTSFDFLFLDRWYYSSFAYALYQQKPEDLSVPLYFLNRLEKEQNIPAYYLSIPESLRQQYLSQKKEPKKLFDDADDLTTKKIANSYRFLTEHSKLKLTANFFETFVGDFKYE